MKVSEERQPALRGVNLPIFTLDDGPSWESAAAQVMQVQDVQFGEIWRQVIRSSRLRANLRKKQARARTGRR
jgi:hypothetical protein